MLEITLNRQFIKDLSGIIQKSLNISGKRKKNKPKDFRKNYKVAVYKRLACADISEEIFRDLQSFIIEHNEISNPINTFIAAFSASDTKNISVLIEKQISFIHRISNKYYPWDKNILFDSSNNLYTLSISGRIFNIKFLYGKIREGAAFTYPLLIFTTGETINIKEIANSALESYSETGS